ncbi:MAG: hypothetical protein V9H26_19595 [Verrucomicrobiota bacterium]
MNAADAPLRPRKELVASGNRSGLSARTQDLLTNHRSAQKRRPAPHHRAPLIARRGNADCPYLLSKKAIDDATAHISRDYSKLASMQVVTARTISPRQFTFTCQTGAAGTT